MRGGAVGGRRKDFASFAAGGILFVHERCCARGENLSSAVQSKTLLCRIIPQLPGIFVHKAGSRFAPRHGGLARLYTNGILECG
jgi:hypothetical protein